MVILRPRRGDLLHAAACLLAILAGGLVVRWGFTRAFPEASIDFRVTADQAGGIAARALEARGFPLDGFRRLVLFDHDDDAKTYLERTLGLARANREYGALPIWHWVVRFVRPLEKLEYVVRVDPAGRVTAFRRLLPETAAAADPGDGAARRIAEEAFRLSFGEDPADRGRFRFVEATSERRPARVDRTFVFESERFRHGDGALRYVVEVQGDRAGRCTSFYRVPEAWADSYRQLRSQNEAAGAVATLGLFLTGLAVLAVFLERIRRRDVKWKTALAFGGTGFGLQLAASLNELPVALFDYDTTQSWANTVFRALLGGVGGAAVLAVVLVLLVAAGEPSYREGCPDRPALGRLFSLRALGTRSVFRGLLLGWTLTVLFVAYQVLFYVGAERLGAWAPAEIPYSNLLGTSFPWLAVLLAGFVPATTEEFSSRMFSIPFVRRFAPAWVAVALPAFIWGFAHSAYPNQPFWIRGVEVGMAGIVIGVVFLRVGIFPLLVWHFTVDAVYTALILVRSSSPSLVAAGSFAGGLLLLPLVAAFLLAVRRGGFLPEEGLSNRSVGSAPAPEPGSEPAGAPAPRSRPLAWILVAAAAAVGLLAAGRLALPRLAFGEGEEYRLDRRAALERAALFVRASGDDPDRYVAASFSASALPSLDSGAESAEGALPYAYSGLAERWLLDRGGPSLLSRWAFRILPGRVWQVRFLRFGDRRSWWVVVDGRSGRVVSFRRFLPEEEAGATLDEGSARARGETALGALGLEPARFSVVSVKSEERKARRDHRIVYESLSERAGDATRRVAVELAGAVPVTVATALKLPESWVRERDRMRPAAYVSLAWKVAGLGIVLGLAVVEILRLARAGALPWRRAARGALWFALAAAAAAAVSAPEALRAAAPGGMSLTTFSVAAGVALLFRVSGLAALAFLALLLVLTVRPDALSRRLWAPTRRSAALSSAAALLLVLAGRSLGSGVTAAAPALAGLGGFPDPPAIDSLVPAVAVASGALFAALQLGAFGALAWLLGQRVLTSWRSRLATAVAVAGVFAPLAPQTAAELLVPLLAALLPGLAWAGAAWLLADDPRAVWLTGSLAVLLPAAWKLGISGVPYWVGNGAVLLALAAAAAAWALREEPAGRAP